MIRIIFHIAVVAGVILLLPLIVSDIVVSDTATALIVAVLWGVVALLIRPVIMLLALPINLITFGLFSLVVNAGLLLLTAALVAGFEVKSFFAALVGGALLSLASSVAHRLV